MITEDRFNIYLKIIQQIIAIIGCILAFFILLDYLLPGSQVIEKLTAKYIESNQRYSGRYNASAYKLFTQERDFYVDKVFFTRVQPEDTLALDLSPFFQSVNSYQNIKYAGGAKTFSLRMVSGLLLPLAMFAVTFLHTKLKSAPVQFLVFIIFIINCVSFFFLII